MNNSRIGTREYITILKSLVDEGREVNMHVLGSSMAPFVVHERDVIYFKKPEKKLCKGDIAFFQRKNGQYVVHRIYKTEGNQYYFVGDNQTDIEGPIDEGQIFATVTRVKRKGKMIGPGDFWWEFFARVWIRIIPVRAFLVRLYGIFNKGR